MIPDALGYRKLTEVHRRSGEWRVGRAGQDCQLPSRNHSRALDRDPRMVARRVAVFAASVDRGFDPTGGRAHPLRLAKTRPVDFRTDAGHDRRMLELLFVVVRALTLALRGHRELVLENLA